MPNPGPGSAKSYTRDNHRCILLIEADPNDAARVISELGTADDEEFHVEWITELPRGIERLRAGGVRAVLLDLTLAGNRGDTFDKVFQAAPRVPILILSSVD